MKFWVSIIEMKHLKLPQKKKQVTYVETRIKLSSAVQITILNPRKQQKTIFKILRILNTLPTKIQVCRQYTGFMDMQRLRKSSPSPCLEILTSGHTPPNEINLRNKSRDK